MLSKSNVTVLCGFLLSKTHPYLKQKLLAYRTITPNLTTKRTSGPKIYLASGLYVHATKWILMDRWTQLLDSVRAVCLRGKIVHQSSFNLWFILQMYIRSSKRSSVPNDLGEKTCRALSLCRIPDTSLNGRRLSNQFLWFFFGNLKDKRVDVHRFLYDTTSLSN